MVKSFNEDIEAEWAREVLRLALEPRRDSLGDFRERLFGLINRALAFNDHRKEDEGDILIECSGVYSQDKQIAMYVSCYVLGPARHYVFKGNTLSDCVMKASEELDKW